jgi:hypothetical protein
VVRRAALLCALAGCELFAGIPEPVDDAVDAGIDGVVVSTCESAEDCVAPLPLCELQTGVCVECLEATDCSAAAPVCIDHACAACTTDEQCGAGVCLLDGTCAEPARILYASPAGTGAACSSQVPCTFDAAVGKLSAATDVIKLGAGTYPRTMATTLTTRAVIAGAGATFDGTGGSGDAMLTNAGADVTVTGLVLTGLGMGGVACNGSGTIRMHRVTFQGVSFAMYSDPCTTEIRRSRFIGNSFYAMYLRNSAATVENVEIARNGNTQFAIAAIVLENATGSLELATVAYNISTGIQCGTSPSFTVKSSIFFQNPLDPACAVTYSTVDPVDPMFVSATTNDFHLAPGSPATNMGDPASTVRLDRDGDPRPQPAGSRADVGADEIP